MSERLDDVRAIEALLRLYGRLNDEGRFHELAELFTADGRFARPADPSRPIVGREAILASFLARPPGPARRHVVAEPETSFDGEDTARVRSLSIVLVDLGEQGGTVSIGAFHDRLKRVDGAWRFESRTGSTLIGSMSHATRDSLQWPAAPGP